MAEENVVAKRNWGRPFAIIALIFGIISLITGAVSFIPLIGLVFAVITIVVAAITIVFGIPGVIGSRSKGMPITALVFGGTMLVWGIVRYFWVVAAVAAAA